MSTPACDCDTYANLSIEKCRLHTPEADAAVMGLVEALTRFVNAYYGDIVGATTRNDAEAALAAYEKAVKP